MTVLIINSPLFRDSNPLYDEDSLPPLGLGYIATALKQNGIEVQLIDAVDQRMSLKKLIEIIHSYKPQFVALNIFTTNCDLVKELVIAIEFDTHFIIGGLSTKQLANEIIYWETPNPIDVVTGDGELIVVDIVKGEIKEKPSSQNGNKRVYLIHKESSYEVKDISDLALDRTFFRNEPVEHRLGFVEANIVASRGCIYNCSFCAAARSLNKDYSIRERSIDSIMRELTEIRANYPLVSSIRVLDDLFLKSCKSVQKAIAIFSHFNYQWRSMAHVMTFNKVDIEEMIALRNSGCFELFIGIESGSPSVLKSINKTNNVDTIIRNLSKVFEAGINMKGYFIYGFPGETEEDMEMTYQLTLKLKEISRKYNANFRTSVFQYRPYHGTQIYHDLEAQGHDLDVRQMAPNKELSSLVGRLQFNFHNGNYAKVDREVLNSYIYRTTNLNGTNIFSKLQPKDKTRKDKNLS